MSCNLPLPPSTTLLFKQSEAATQLSRLIVENSHVERWVFKIDGDINSRGIAFFDVYSNKKLASLIRDHADAATDDQSELTAASNDLLMTRADGEQSKKTQYVPPRQSSILFADIQREVSRLLPKKLQFAKREVFKDYYHFIEEFCRRGGIVEASPTVISKNINSVGVLFQLEPDGEVEIQTTFEKILVSPFNTCGFKFPQSALPNLNVKVDKKDPSTGRDTGISTLPEGDVWVLHS